MLVGERSQPEMVTCYKIPAIECSGEGKTVETVKRSDVVRDWREGEMERQM